MTTPATPDKNGWLPIASAPNDGTAYLIWCSERRNTYIVVWRDMMSLGEEGWWHFGGGGYARMREQPTHYQPLPAPPVSL